MIKLSELKDDENLLYCERIYTVKEVKEDLKYFTDDDEEKLYTTTGYHASIDARTVLEEAFNSEYENQMYEDWDEKILNDITDEDVEKIQAVFDEILSRNKSSNIAYFQGEEVEVDL